MSYKTKPQIKLYKYNGTSFILQAIIDDYMEFSFEDNLYSAGAFTISINYNIPNALLFQRGLFVAFGDGKRFGEIINITDAIGSDGKGSQIRTITGYDARYIFKRRIIKNLNNVENWAMTDKGELCMRNLIADQCGSNAEVKRQLPVINDIPAAADAIGKEYSVSESFSNLYEVLCTIATQSEIGWRLDFDGEKLKLVCFNGVDRHNSVRFDTNYESLSQGQFTDSADSYANSVYVGGKGQGDDRDIYEGEALTDGNAPEGLDRFEAWDNQSSMTTSAEYEAEALSILTQYGQTLQVSGKGLAKSPYIYGKEYEVGDIITISFSGKSAVVQILSVTEHWAFNSYDINFSFGKPQPDLNNQLQLILKQIQKASNKTNSTDSVRWYTIPTDTEMPSSDVTYRTIGFIGDCGAGANFKLYLDNEKTGSKTYHVYFKQLVGGKLTLTTGVVGATNLVLNSGTYVAIVYVDENGNISSQGMTATDTIQTGNNQPATSSGVAGAISDEASARNTAITDAINALDVASVGGSGKYISAISETDGKISATVGDIDSTVIGGSNNPVTSGAVANAISNVTPIDSVKYNNFHPITSNAIYWQKFYCDKTANLSTKGWYKIATFGKRNNGAVVRLELKSSFFYVPSCSHHIELVYGWQSLNLKDFANDSLGVFSKLKLCYNDNNKDVMALYVYYSPNKTNSVEFSIELTTSTDREVTLFNFTTDSDSYDNEIIYNLGTNGTMLNADDSSLVDISNLITMQSGVSFVYAYRKGNVCYVYIYGTYTGSPTAITQNIISGLPQKYIPKIEQTFCGASYITTSPYVYPCRVRIKTNGNIDFEGTAFPTNTSIRIGFTYVID